MITPNSQFGTVPSPLMYQYMTQGQMGYMPQSQYLTPSEYGSFRSTPEQQGLDPAIQQHSLWQNYLIANQGRIPWMPGMDAPFSIDTYNPGVRQMEELRRARRRLDDTLGSFQSSLVGGAVPMALSMIPGLGVGGGIAMGVGSSMLSSMGIDAYENQLRRSRSLQNRTYNAVTVGGDTAANRRGMSLSASTALERSMRHMSADTYEFNSADLDSMFDQGLKNDLFAFSSSAQDYKKTLKLIKENITDLADAMGTADFGELAEQMKRLQKFGAGLEKAVSTTRQETMFSRISGMSHDKMIQMYGNAGAASYSSRGLTGYQGSLASMAGAASLTIGERLGIYTAGDISRMGGVSGGAQSFTDSGANVMSSQSDALMALVLTPSGEIDPEGIRTLLNSDYSTSLQIAARKYSNLSPSQIANYDMHRGELMENIENHAGGAYAASLVAAKMARSVGNHAGLAGDEGLEYGLATLVQSGIINKAAAKQYFEQATNPELRSELRKQGRQELKNFVKNQSIKHKRENAPEARISKWWEQLTSKAFDVVLGGSASSRAIERDFEEGVTMGDYSIPDMGLTGLEPADVATLSGNPTASRAMLAGDWEGFQKALRFSGDGKYLSRGTAKERFKADFDTEVIAQYKLLELADKTPALSDADQAELEAHIQSRFGLSDSDMVFFRHQISTVVNSADDFTPAAIRNLVRDLLKSVGMDGSQLADTVGGMTADPRTARYIAGVSKRTNADFTADIHSSQQDALERQKKAQVAGYKYVAGDGGSAMQKAQFAAFDQGRDGNTRIRGQWVESKAARKDAFEDLNLLVQASAYSDDILADGNAQLAEEGIRGFDISTVAQNTDLSMDGYTRSAMLRELTRVLEKRTGSWEEARALAEKVWNTPSLKTAFLAGVAKRKTRETDAVITGVADIRGSAAEKVFRKLVTQGSTLRDRTWDFAGGGNTDSDTQGAFFSALKESPNVLTVSSMAATMSSYLAADGEDPDGVHRRSLRALGKQLGLSSEQIDGVIDSGSLRGIKDSTGLSDSAFQAAVDAGRLKGAGGLRSTEVANLPSSTQRRQHKMITHQAKKASAAADMVLSEHGVTRAQLMSHKGVADLLNDESVMQDPKMAALVKAAQSNHNSANRYGFAGVVGMAALGDMGASPEYSTTDTTQRLSSVQTPEYKELVQAFIASANALDAMGSLDGIPKALTDLNATMQLVNSALRKQGQYAQKSK